MLDPNKTATSPDPETLAAEQEAAKVEEQTTEPKDDTPGTDFVIQRRIPGTETDDNPAGLHYFASAAMVIDQNLVDRIVAAEGDFDITNYQLPETWLTTFDSALRFPTETSAKRMVEGLNEVGAMSRGHRAEMEIVRANEKSPEGGFDPQAA